MQDVLQGEGDDQREAWGVKQKVTKVYANLTCQLSHGDAYSLHVMAPGDTHIKRGICANICACAVQRTRLISAYLRMPLLFSSTGYSHKQSMS